jgi:hypothetical protein
MLPKASVFAHGTLGHRQRIQALWENRLRIEVTRGKARMPTQEREVDLRGEAQSRVQTAAFYEVRDLAPGEVVLLVTADDPGLMMRSLDLQLRETLAWSIEGAAGDYRTRVQLRSDTEVGETVDLLVRDHRRLDELFAKALRKVNANDVAGARPLVEVFAAAIRRHVELENELLAPILPRPRGPDGSDHVEIMLREHEEILRQLAEVESCFAEAAAPEAWEVEPFIAILSGTLAKHEYREESNLFPHWHAALAALDDDRRDELFGRARALLGS